MKLAVLFWFYKDFSLCIERLNRVRKLNPGTKIFALYGGDLESSAIAYKQISPLVNDFFCYTRQAASTWKWRNGDQLIATWYSQRGKFLDWDTIFIMQWDMLVLHDPLCKIFSNLQPNQILLSGFTPFDRVADWWGWAIREKDEVKRFKRYLEQSYGYTGDLYACLFIIACLPRVFLSKYSLAVPEIGFIEYRLPTMAKVFNLDVYLGAEFEPWWAANPNTRNIDKQGKTLNAVGEDIDMLVVLKELQKSNGRRIFHPYRKHFPELLDIQLLSTSFFYCYRSMNIFARFIAVLPTYVKCFFGKLTFINRQ